ASVRANCGDISSGRLRTPTTSTPAGGATPGPSAGVAGAGGTALNGESSSMRGGGLRALPAGSSSSSLPLAGGALGGWAGDRPSPAAARSTTPNRSSQRSANGGMGRTRDGEPGRLKPPVVGAIIPDPTGPRCAGRRLVGRGI